MTVTKIFTEWHDSGSSPVTSPQNYGPVTVPADFTLVRAEWNGIISFPGTTATNVALTIFQELAFGIQFVANGGTALDIESIDKNKDQWLFLGNPVWRTFDTETVIADSASQFSVTRVYGVDGSWRGQRPLPQALDFRISTGVFFTPEINYRLFLNLTLWYSD